MPIDRTKYRCVLCEDATSFSNMTFIQSRPTRSIMDKMKVWEQQRGMEEAVDHNTCVIFVREKHQMCQGNVREFCWPL